MKGNEMIGKWSTLIRWSKLCLSRKDVVAAHSEQLLSSFPLLVEGTSNVRLHSAMGKDDKILVTYSSTLNGSATEEEHIGQTREHLHLREHRVRVSMKLAQPGDTNLLLRLESSSDSGPDMD